MPLCGGPQMVEISRDGRRVYATNSLYASWDEVFYPDGVGAWMAKLDADVSAGGLVADSGFFPHGEDFRGLQRPPNPTPGGDASATPTAYQLTVRRPRSKPAVRPLCLTAARSARST